MKVKGETFVNTGDWIRKWAMIQPDKAALVEEGKQYSYRDLNRRIIRLSNFFLGAGLKKGDRVAVLLRNCREYIEIFFALSKIGGILVPLNWRLVLPELEFIIKDSGSRFIIFDGDFIDNAITLQEKIPMDVAMVCIAEGSRIEELPNWMVDYETSLHGCSNMEIPVPWSVGGEDAHILMDTSGTTGLPKGAILSHRKTFFNVLNADIYFDLTRHDIAIIVRPMFHSGGLIVDMAPVLYKGGTVIIKRRFAFSEILATAEQYKVTILELPATVYNFIIEECDIDRYDLSSVKCCFTGGERVPIALLQAFAGKGIIISQIYGLTEASTIFWLPTDKAVMKMGSVGQPVIHGEVRIVDGRGNSVNPGEIGEIIVRGPILMSGYWKRPDLTQKVIKNGWLHTGDLARVDEDGFTYIIDRKKDMFISGGENVYPAEVEKALFSHPGVIDVAVLGVPDKKWGEVGKAFIEPREGYLISAEEVRIFLADKLARYKIPQYIEFIGKLPKTASGKIKKHLLK
jgi:fatty-acyl-CoA synthase